MSGANPLPSLGFIATAKRPWQATSNLLAGKPIGLPGGYATLEHAIRALSLLTKGPSAPAAAVVERGGRYFGYQIVECVNAYDFTQNFLEWGLPREKARVPHHFENGGVKRHTFINDYFNTDGGLKALVDGDRVVVRTEKNAMRYDTSSGSGNTRYPWYARLSPPRPPNL